MSTPTLLDEPIAATALGGVASRVRRRVAGLALPERTIPLGILLVVVAVFVVGIRNEFVRWDDHRNLLENPHYRGLGFSQIAWMFTTTLMGHYIPLTWLTFGVDYLIWGMEPAGYHFTNLALHSANAVLFYWVAKRLLRAARPGASEIALRAGAAAAALFFAIHPLRAESVAWVTERRDVLSGLFFLTCVLTYLRATSAAGTRRRWLLALSVACFALAMLAKSIVMTLPLLLVVIDWYPLRRLQPLRWSDAVRRVVLEKLPFLAVGVAGGVVAYWAVGHNDYFTPMTSYPLPARTAMALYSIVFYMSKTVLPIDLSPLYELPRSVDPFDPQFLGAGIAVVLVTVTSVALARRWPVGLAAYAWYVIMLAPVGGLVHAGFQLAHDRYSYLSCLSFAMLVGGGSAWLVGAYAVGTVRPPLFGATCAALVALLAALGALTWLQVQVWRDTESLWTHAAYATPECAMCHENYAGVLVNRSPTRPGDVLIAVEHFQQALVLRPDRDKAYGGLGLALIHLGHFRDAEAALRRGVAAAPTNAAPLNNLGLVLNQQRRFAEALPYLRRAVALEPSNVTARANLGQALVGVGRLDEAIPELRRATDEQPFAPEPRIAIVLAYQKARNTVEMRKQFTILRQLHPVMARDLAAKHRL